MYNWYQRVSQWYPGVFFSMISESSGFLLAHANQPSCIKNTLAHHRSTEPTCWCSVVYQQLPIMHGGVVPEDEMRRKTGLRGLVIPWLFPARLHWFIVCWQSGWLQPCHQDDTLTATDKNLNITSQTESSMNFSNPYFHETQKNSINFSYILH